MEVDDLPIELEVADALKSGHLMMGTALWENNSFIRKKLLFSLEETFVSL